MMTDTLPTPPSPTHASQDGHARQTAHDAVTDPRLALEWLETDGCGGYASSTALLCHTRRQHGLLVAPIPGAATRYVLLSRFDEVLRDAGGHAHELSVARYPALFAPRGDRALRGFELAPHPVATYEFGQARLVREVRTLRGRHAVLVRYFLEEAPGPHTLELRPLLPFREADALTIENDRAHLTATAIPAGVSFQPYTALPALSLTASREAPFEADPVWFRNLRFDADRARGYEGREDEPSPGVLRVTLAPGEDVIIAAATGESVADPRAAWRDSLRRDAKVRDRLERAADDFLYRTPDGRLGVIAGFPWFLEWGRDTFLALPGLTLARGRHAECAEVLTGALPFLKQGLLPNVFGVGALDSHYGSADAALWFARAVLLFERSGGNKGLVRRELRPALEAIAEAYFAGTELGVHVDQAGMLQAGGPDLNPTWMDAQTSGGPVTPRHGSPVEICALWCSLLAQLRELAASKAAKKTWGERSRAANATFQERFWVASEKRLADVWRDGVQDLAVRPNMVLAASLELAPLTRTQRQAIVRCARAQLLTPRGLRTLAPTDPDYVARYAGGPEQRDAAYHQGSVWPWLLGPYVEATVRAYAPTRARLAELSLLLDGLAPELDRAGLNHVSEVFDGDQPHAPGGTIAQAWNAAEWLRARHLLEEARA